MTKFSPMMVLGVCLISLGISGCETFNLKGKTETDVASEFDEQILQATQSIQNAQLQLYQAGVLNDVPGVEPLDLRDEGRLISVAWQGDAEQLLAKIAKDSRRKFKTMGVKLPLPVDIDVKDATLNHFIGHVQAQVGYRAVVSYTPSQITLHYSKR